MKLSAAWLIQHAGFEKGFGLEGAAREIAGGRASLSTKHTLAITNRGDATAEDIFRDCPRRACRCCREIRG